MLFIQPFGVEAPATVAAATRGENEAAAGPDRMPTGALPSLYMQTMRGSAGTPKVASGWGADVGGTRPRRLVCVHSRSPDERRGCSKAVNIPAPAFRGVFSCCQHPRDLDPQHPTRAVIENPVVLGDIAFGDNQAVWMPGNGRQPPTPRARRSGQTCSISAPYASCARMDRRQSDQALYTNGCPGTRSSIGT